MNYKWKFFEEIIYNTLILTVVFVKHDFYTDMLITGLAILHSTYRCIDKTLINETCDRKAICNGSLSKTPRLANSDPIWLKLIANENYLWLTLIANEKNWL